MLELRYNGCSDCLASMRAYLAGIGLFSGKNYRVEFHSDHKHDKIYKSRPDYLKHFSGGILYKPETGEWIDFYNGGSNIIASNDANRRLILRFAGVDV